MGAIWRLAAYSATRGRELGVGDEWLLAFPQIFLFCPGFSCGIIVELILLFRVVAVLLLWLRPRSLTPSAWLLNLTSSPHTLGAAVTFWCPNPSKCL